MNTLEYIRDKYSLDFRNYSPIEIPNITRVQLAELFGELKFKKGVEVGVAQGKYSQIMVENNPHLEMLWGVDPYEPHQGYRDYSRESTFNKMEQNAHEKLDQYPNYTFVKKYSHEAVKDFEDGSLDFVYIDGDHCFDAVVNDITMWSKKVRKGGIVSGDDYFKSRGNARIQVVPAVKGYTEAWRVYPWFLIGSGAKIPGQPRDAGRSWMWVKP